MYKYLFTNDLRLYNNFDEFSDYIKDVAENVKNNISASDLNKKGQGNTFTTARFYMNLMNKNGELSNCGKAALDNKVNLVLYNFIKKFQYPNFRTPTCVRESRDNNIQIAPLRSILKLLMLNYLQEGSSAYITKDELKENILFNRRVATNVDCNLGDVLNEIMSVRNGAEKSPDINCGEYDILERQFGQFITLLRYAGFIQYYQGDETKISINIENLNEEEKSVLLDIICDNSFFEVTDDSTKEDYYNYMDIDYDSGVRINLDEKMQQVKSIDKPYNYIIFGAPGTGKSNSIEQNRSCFGENYERVTFYSNYSYAQFVGSYKPVTRGGNIVYEYVPGPFLRVLTKAYKSLIEDDEPQNFLLIVEEINRANAAAVFGDVFQLLDRKNGVSEYAIAANEEIQLYLVNELGGKKEDYQYIKIPNNMYIWATMNSADQGVYPMDTAFKRRWTFKYIDINNNEELNDTEIVVKGDKFKWNTLRRAINDKLSKMNNINEDKMIGPFFLSNDDLINNFNSTFKSKLLMYLYDDVLRHRKSEFFKKGINTYSQLVKEFDLNGFDIFTFKIEKVNDIKEEQSQAKVENR